MKKNQLLIFLFFTLIVSFKLKGQTSTSKLDWNSIVKVDADLVTGEFTSEFPFYTPFIIAISNKEKLHLTGLGRIAILYEKFRGPTYFDIGVENFVKIFSEKEDPDIPLSSLTRTFKNYVEWFKIDKMNDTLFYAQIPPLKPNKYYDIILESKISSKNLVDFLKLLDESNGWSELHPKVINYIKIRNENQIGKYATQFNFDDKTLQFCKALWGMKSLIKKSKFEKITFVENKKYQENLFLFINKLVELEIEIENISALHNILGDDTLHFKLLNGLISIDKLKTITHHDYYTRLKNIQTTTKTLKDIKSEMFLNTLVNIENKGDSTVEFIDQLVYQLAANSEVLSKKLKLIEKMFEEREYFTEIFLAGTTRSKNFNERYKQRLVADFGLIGIAPRLFSDEEVVTPDNEIVTEIFGRPFLGVNFHLSPINPTQSLSNVPFGRGKLVSMTSLSFGVTLGKIEHPLYKDILTNFSLYGGFNLKLADTIRFGIGGSILRESNVNPILARSSIILAPSVLLSFDYALTEQLGKGIAKLLN